MLTESASRPTTRSSVPNLRQDPRKVLANLAFLAQRNEEIAVGAGSRTDYVSEVGRTLLSTRPASIEALRGGTTEDRVPVDRCSLHDPGSGTAGEDSSARCWEPKLPRPIGRS